MFTDIVFIKDKEDALRMAKSLGFSDLLFLQKTDLISDIKDLKRAIKPVIFVGQNDDVNRKAICSGKIDILINVEPLIGDSLSYRKSGLNQVLCKFAHENNVAIGINFSRLLHENDRLLLLGKIMQNIRLCRKYKVKIMLATFANNIYELRAAKDLISLGVVLGMTPLEAKNSLTYAINRSSP